MDAERMRAALHEVWKYYDEAGESGENYVLAPDNLAKFATDLCREYEADRHSVTETVGKRCRTSSSRPTPAFINQLSLKAINWRLMQRSTSLHKEENHHAGCEHRNHG